MTDTLLSEPTFYACDDGRCSEGRIVNRSQLGAQLSAGQHTFFADSMVEGAYVQVQLAHVDNLRQTDVMVIAQCAEGYMGKLCEKCARVHTADGHVEAYYRRIGRCLKCPDTKAKKWSFKILLVRPHFFKRQPCEAPASFLHYGAFNSMQFPPLRLM